MGAERRVEPISKLNQAHSVSMTTLRVATIRQCYTEKTGETNNTCHILTMKKRGTGGLREKLKENCPAALLSGLTTEALQ